MSAVRIVILALGCFTVVALLVAAALIPEPSGAGAPSLPAVQATVERFVVATNAVVANGDDDIFDEVLAAEFVLHAEEAGLGADRAALVQYLAGIRISFPGLVFVPGEIAADGNVAMLRLATRGAVSGVLSGLPVQPAPAPDNGFIVLRLAGRRVAELWNFVPLPAVEPMATLTVFSRTSGPVVGAMRVTYAPGAGEPDRVPPGPVIVSLEQGILFARVKGTAGIVRVGAIEQATITPATPGGEIELRPGEILIVPALTWYSLRNAGSEQAEALVVAVLPTATTIWPALEQSAGPVTMTWPGSPVRGVSFARTVGGYAPRLPAGRLRIELTRVSLAPGIGVTLPPGDWAALVIPESGSLRLESGDAASPLGDAGNGAVLAPGDGEYAVSASARNDGALPARALVIGITPVDP